MVQSDRDLQQCPELYYALIGKDGRPIHLYITVLCIPIARQRLGKHIPAQANSINNMTFIASHRISKHASVTVEAVFTAGSLQSDYKEVFGSI
jgi:hypothetical protein